VWPAAGQKILTEVAIGYDQAEPDSKDKAIVARSFDEVSEKLLRYLAQSHMDHLEGKRSRRSPAELSSTSDGRALVQSLFIRPYENPNNYAAYFKCPNDRPIYIAAGRLFILERGDNTEVQFVRLMSGTMHPFPFNGVTCNVTPGFVSKLLSHAGIGEQ
jgi:hypothetical protein